MGFIATPRTIDLRPNVRKYPALFDFQYLLSVSGLIPDVPKEKIEKTLRTPEGSRIKAVFALGFNLIKVADVAGERTYFIPEPGNSSNRLIGWYFGNCLSKKKPCLIRSDLPNISKRPFKRHKFAVILYKRKSVKRECLYVDGTYVMDPVDRNKSDTTLWVKGNIVIEPINPMYFSRKL